MGALDGRRAIVTGAGSGIGRGIAGRLATEGAAVVIADLDEPAAVATAAAIVDAGGQALAVRCDVTVDLDCVAAVSRAVDAFGGLDLLVNNAGIIRRRTVVETSEAEWDLVIAVNLKSVFLMSRHAIPAMAAGGRGAIVNIASGWGLKGGARAASYCASKAAVVNLTRAMAIDHAADGIRVVAVAPGDTDTGMLRHEAAELGEDLLAFLESSAARPIHRLGTPDDIARAVVFLASDEAAWVTGTTLVVDGGGMA
jgi:NAD(P)-dependent dehydrogenase (short-subunit alcohol dehydrogenase family)